MLSGFLITLRKLSVAAYENVAHVFSRTNPGIRARFIITGLIALVFTAGVLQWSFKYGRLAYDITYDDVGYFLDAYRRINVFYEQGLGAMLVGLFQNPPHSPYSSLLAFIGFALFGPADWAPYFMNGIALFLFLGFIAYLLRSMHFIFSVVFLIMFLFVPVSFYMVHEYRPDFAVALFSCIFAFLAFESLSVQQNHARFKLRSSGAVFGLALLSKPTFFAHTLALGFTVAAFIIMHQILDNYRQRQQLKGNNILNILRDLYLPGLVLSLPYYALNWRHVWNHFWINTRGEQSGIWNFKGSFWEVLKAFLGGASYSMLSSYLFFFLAVIMSSFLFFLQGRKWRDVNLLAGLMSVAVASLGIIVYGRHDNVYFGLTYQIMLCFAMCYCLSALYRNKWCFAFVLLGFIVFSGWHSLSKPMPEIFGNQTLLARKANSLNLEIIKAIESHMKGFALKAAPIKVFFSFAGEVNTASAEWLALQKSIPVQFSDSHTRNDMDAYKKAIRQSDFVVVSDEDSDPYVIYHWLPSFTIQKQVLDFLRTQPAMEEIRLWKTSREAASGYIRLFANKSKLLHRNSDVSLQYPVSGFLPPEGPYPQWRLPRVRWGIFPESQITLPAGLSGKIIIILSARSKPGTKLSVTLNEEEVYRHVFSGDAFEDIDTSMFVAAGVKRLYFKYYGRDDGDKDRAVLFQDIRILTASK